MEDLKADDDQETSTFKTISISVGIRNNYNEKGSEKLPCPGPFGLSTFAEAKKRLKKLERDYQHTYDKYTELQSDWSRYHTELRNLERNIYWDGYCIVHIKNMVEQLHNVLENLNTEEAPQRLRETSSNGKRFFLKHGCKSLAQEKMILQLKEKNIEQDSDDLSQESIDVKRIDKTLSYIQRIIPESSNKKPLLRRVKDVKKLTEKAISNGELLVGNLTSHQDNMKNCTSIKIKLLTEAIRDFEKERGATENILQRKTRTEKGCSEKMRVLKGKCEYIGEKRDAEKKHTSLI